MNLAMICFLGTDLDVVLRKYTECFLSGFDIGLTNRYIAYMHEQTIFDNPIAVEVDLVHIVFEENCISRVESTILKIMNMDVFPKNTRISFTCLKNDRKNKQLDSSDLINRLSMQIGGVFNGCSYWSLSKDWSLLNHSLLKSIQNRNLCHLIEDEGLNFGKAYAINKVPILNSKLESVMSSAKESKVIGESF